MEGFVDIKDLAEISGGSTLIGSGDVSNQIITIMYGIIPTPVPEYGVRPLYGIYPITLDDK